MASEDRTPVLVSAARTPVGRFSKGLKHLDATELGGAAVSAAVERAGGHIPEHVFLGNVVQAGNGQNPARVAGIKGGLPETVPATTVNDVCLASMSATGMAATQIRAGEIDSAIVGGFDSMSRALHGVPLRAAPRVGDSPMIDLLVRDGLWCALTDRGMGSISEEANDRLGIDRVSQDEVALESHRRAAAAAASGRLAVEIVKGGLGPVAADEGIRPDTTLEALSALSPAFDQDGTITAGNASQMSDAGAAGMVMSRALASALGLAPMVEIVGRGMISGPDASLHLKPALAARKLLDRQSLKTIDVGLWEINEAFAGVLVATLRDLELDFDQVNVNGGAIAIGHPLGASGFRLIQTLAVEMADRSVEYGVATMCGGGGQGEAVLLRLV